jgi:hypothetical protein
VARSAAADRSLAVLLGEVLPVGGSLVALLAYGAFGSGRATHPLLDPVIVDALRAQPVLARLVAILAGVALVVLGLTWANLVLAADADTAIVVDGDAAARAVAGQAAALAGVAPVRARMVGSREAPALQITVWLTDEADVVEILRRLDQDVVGGARAALDPQPLPVAVRLELAGAGSRSGPPVIWRGCCSRVTLLQPDVSRVALLQPNVSRVTLLYPVDRDPRLGDPLTGDIPVIRQGGRR